MGFIALADVADPVAERGILLPAERHAAMSVPEKGKASDDVIDCCYGKAGSSE